MKYLLYMVFSMKRASQLQIWSVGLVPEVDYKKIEKFAFAKLMEQSFP